MGKIKIIVGVLLVFALGIAAGILGTKMYFKHRMEQFARIEHPPVKRLLMERLSSSLDLTEAQQKEIEKIVSRTMKEVHALKRTYQPELQKIINGGFDEISRKLNEDQKKKLKEFRDTMHWFRGRWRFSHYSFSQSAEAWSDHFMASVNKHLTLTEDQQTRVRDIIQDYMKQRRTLVRGAWEAGPENYSTSPAQLKELNRDTEKKLEQILTVDQMQEYREVWKEQIHELNEAAPPTGETCEKRERGSVAH